MTIPSVVAREIWDAAAEAQFMTCSDASVILLLPSKLRL